MLQPHMPQTVIIPYKTPSSVPAVLILAQENAIGVAVTVVACSMTF